MRPFALFTICHLYVSMGLLASEEKKLPDGLSPDSAHELVLIADGTDPQLFKLAVRATDSQKIIFTVPLGGYASLETAALPFNMKCLWSPDSRFVAVASRGTKRSGETRVYHIVGDKVAVVSLPDLAVNIRPQLEADIRAFFVRPEVWLPDHELVVSIIGTQEREENGVYRFIAFLALRGESAARLKSLQRDRTIDQ